MSKIALLAGGCALAFGVAACGSGSTTATAGASPAPAVSSAPVESTSAPAGFAPVGPGATIQAERQFSFGTVQSGGQKLLTVGSDGIVKLDDHLTDRALFVTTPVRVGGDEYLMQTAKLVEGGEPWCLAVHSPGGSASLQLKTAACDASKKDQIFTFLKTQDGKGRLIEVNGLFVLAPGGDEIIVQESGEGDGLTGFTVRDQGKSTLSHPGD